MTILAYFDKPMSTYLSSLFINSLKLIIVFGTLYKYSGIKKNSLNCWNDQLVPRNFNLSKKVKQYFYDSYV
jgi:hypothetical protein